MREQSCDLNASVKLECLLVLLQLICCLFLRRFSSLVNSTFLSLHPSVKLQQRLLIAGLWLFLKPCSCWKNVFFSSLKFNLHYLFFLENVNVSSLDQVLSHVVGQPFISFPSSGKNEVYIPSLCLSVHFCCHVSHVELHIPYWPIW